MGRFRLWSRDFENPWKSLNQKIKLYSGELEVRHLGKLNLKLNPLFCIPQKSDEITVVSFWIENTKALITLHSPRVCRSYTNLFANAPQDSSFQMRTVSSAWIKNNEVNYNNSGVVVLNLIRLQYQKLSNNVEQQRQATPKNPYNFSWISINKCNQLLLLLLLLVTALFCSYFPIYFNIKYHLIVVLMFSSPLLVHT